MPLTADLGVDVDDGVAFRYVVTNAGDEAVDLRFRSGQTADVVVLADGDATWRWSEGRQFTQALRSERLGPGEAIRVEATWDDPSPGRYEAVATLAAEDADAEARAAFEVG